MKNMTATNAAKNFGQLVNTVQSEPVTIESNGRAVAVVYSYSEAMALQAEIEKHAEDSVMRGLDDVKAGRTVSFDNDLIQKIKAEVIKELDER